MASRAVGDGQAAEAGTSARRPDARSRADRFQRRPPPACGWRRRARRSSPPRSPSSTGPSSSSTTSAGSPSPRTRHVADHFLPGWVDAADLEDVRIELVEGDTLRVAQAVRSGEAEVGFTEGPAAPLGLRSEVVANEQIVAGRRAPPPVVPPPAGHRRSTTSWAPCWPCRGEGSGTLDVVEAALAPFEFAAIGDRLEVSSSARRGSRRSTVRPSRSCPGAGSRTTSPATPSPSSPSATSPSSSRCASCARGVRPPARSVAAGLVETLVVAQPTG